MIVACRQQEHQLHRCLDRGIVNDQQPSRQNRLFKLHFKLKDGVTKL